MASSSLFLLIDDIATLLDDVSVMTKVAAKKTAGVLGDDLALNAQQVTGVKADRELPVVWAVAKGSMLKHEKLIEFIQRNYAVDAQGQWYFQNGPQRVYVELEATPWVWRIGADFAITAHSGEVAQYQASVMDENGWLYLQTTLGFGLVHTQDVAQAAQAIEAGLWLVTEASLGQLPARYGYVTSPQNRQKSEQNAI